MFYNKTIKERDSGGRGRRTHLVAIHFILKKVVHRAKILERYKSRIVQRTILQPVKKRNLL